MSLVEAISVRSETGSLEQVRGWLAAFVEKAGSDLFPLQASKVVNLALIEAVDNAIFHAHQEQAEKLIDIRARIENGCIILEVVDQGPGLNRAAQERLHEPPPFTVPDVEAVSGRGLFLIRTLMHEVESVMHSGKHVFRMMYWFKREEASRGTT